jgi:DNA-directed RNA polymerase specialized sigma24 family protein
VAALQTAAIAAMMNVLVYVTLIGQTCRRDKGDFKDQDFREVRLPDSPIWSPFSSTQERNYNFKLDTVAGFFAKLFKRRSESGRGRFSRQLLPSFRPAVAEWGVGVNLTKNERLGGLPERNCDGAYLFFDAIQRTMPESIAPLQHCFHRIRSWRVPPNWSARDWSVEVEAVVTAAACEAQFDFDRARQVPLGGFVYRRVMARALTRYRQEWAYALRFLCENDTDGLFGITANGASWAEETANALVLDYESLRHALERLSQADRKLIHELFWDKCTQTELARKLRMSQQAVSLRKVLIIKNLRNWLGASNSNSEREGQAACKRYGSCNLIGKSDPMQMKVITRNYASPVTKTLNRKTNEENHTGRNCMYGG